MLPWLALLIVTGPLLGVAVFTLVMRTGTMKRFLASLKPPEHKRGPRVIIPRPARLALIPLPWSTALFTIVAATYALVMLAEPELPLYATAGIKLISSGIGAIENIIRSLGLLESVVLYERRYTSRRTRYEEWLILLIPWLLWGRFLAIGMGADASPFDLLYLPAGMLLSGAAATLILRRARSESRRTIGAMWRCIGLLTPLIVVGILFNVPLAYYMLPVLTLRFVLGEYLLATPILYLRSFGMSHTPLNFGRLVAPIAKRFGMLVALFHVSEMPRNFHRLTSRSNYAEPVFLLDWDWHRYVEDLLCKSWAVIIDGSQLGDGLKWEITHALALVPAQRVCLLVQAAEAKVVSFDEGLLYLDCDLQSDAGIEAAQAHLVSWSKQLTRAPTSPLLPDAASALCNRIMERLNRPRPTPQSGRRRTSLKTLISRSVKIVTFILFLGSSMLFGVFNMESPLLRIQKIARYDGYEVRYGRGATERDALGVCRLLQKDGFPKEATVFLEKAMCSAQASCFTAYFVVKDGTWTEELNISAFQQIRSQLSCEVFSRAPVVVHLTDSWGQTKRKLEPSFLSESTISKEDPCPVQP